MMRSRSILSGRRRCATSSNFPGNSGRPRDRMAGFRVLQLLPGIGPATAAHVLDEVAAAGSMRALAQAPPPRAAKGWQELLQFFGEIGHEARGWPAELTALRDWYAPH